MFDIGFSEILVIAVVALIVIGPERLPKAARTLGHLFGRMQRYVNEVKADVSREIELEELRKLRQEVQTAATDIEKSVSSTVQQVESSVRSVESDLNLVGDEAAEMEPLPRPVAGGASGASPAAYGPDEAARQPSLPGLADDAARQPSLPGFERG